MCASKLFFRKMREKNLTLGTYCRICSRVRERVWRAVYTCVAKQKENRKRMLTIVHINSESGFDKHFFFVFAVDCILPASDNIPCRTVCVCVCKKLYIYFIYIRKTLFCYHCYSIGRLFHRKKVLLLPCDSHIFVWLFEFVFILSLIGLSWAAGSHCWLQPNTSS